MLASNIMTFKKKNVRVDGLQLRTARNEKEVDSPTNLYNPVGLTTVPINVLSSHGRMGFVGGTIRSFNYDFATKVANSVAECPLKIYRGQIDPASPPAPGDAAWVEETRQSAIDKLKVQNELPITSTNVSGRTAVYNSQTYVTQDTSHPAERDDYAGKVAGDVTGNPHIAYRSGAETSLSNPSQFITELTDLTGSTGYPRLTTIDNSCVYQISTANMQIPQFLLAFNLVEAYKRKFGYIPADGTLAGEIDWLKKNLKSIKCNTHIYGSCPAGNRAKLAARYLYDNSWLNAASNNTAGSPTLTSMDSSEISGAPATAMNYLIGSDGFVYYLIYTDASDGVTVSTVYLDYANIELQVASEAGYDTLVPPNPRRDSVVAPNYDTILSLAKVYADETHDFTNKIAGSTTENANIRKGCYNTSVLEAPNSANWQESSQDFYNKIKILDGQITTTTTQFINGNIAQQLFAFNIIADVEKIIGTIPVTITGVPATDLANKIQWIKDNWNTTSAIAWTGYGNCPAGNKASIAFWNGASWSTAGSNTASNPSTISWAGNFSPYIMADGFVYVLAYTDASDGITTSQINTDYVKFTIKFKQPTTAIELMTQNAVDVDVQVANKASAYMVEVDLTPVCSAMHGGSNAAIKAALQNLYWEFYATGSGALNAALANGCTVLNYTTAWGNGSQSTIASITKLYKSYLNSNLIQTNNKIYILIYATYPSDGTIPSSVSLDFISVRVDFTRVADIVNPVPVVAPADGKFAVVGRFSPCWKNDISGRDSGICITNLYKDTNNRCGLWYVPTSDVLRITHEVLDVIKLGTGATNEVFAKNQAHSFIMEQYPGYIRLRVLKNNGTVEKNIDPITGVLTGALNMIMGMYMNSNIGYNADSLFDLIKFLPGITIDDDTTAENILRGIDAGGITTQFTQPELCPSLDTWFLSSEASLINGEIVITSVSGINKAWGPVINVLPNNKYYLSVEMLSNVTQGKGNMDIQQKYNTIQILDDNGPVAINDNQWHTYGCEYITSARCNKINLRVIADDGFIGTVKIRNISFKLKM